MTIASWAKIRKKMIPDEYIFSRRFWFVPMKYATTVVSARPAVIQRYTLRSSGFVRACGVEIAFPFLILLI